MAWFDRLLGRSASQAESWAQWIEPVLPAPSEDWDRRLRAYGMRCARELEQAGAPKWTSRKGRGDNAYRNAFWVVSVDIEAANRYMSLWSPQGTLKPNTFNGSMRGYALILTGAGGVFCSKFEMWFPPSGNHEEGDLDSVFYAPSQELLSSSPWAGRNTGRWHRQPDVKVYGAVAQTFCSEFKCAYPPYAFSKENPGKGSSIALKKFVEGGGKTQWPRHFANYP